MDKKVIVSSFHTCSAFAMLDEDQDFDIMISFDSHIDDRLAGYRGEVVKAIENNLPMRYTTGRAAAHIIFKKTIGDLINGTYIVCPQSCIETDVGYYIHEMKKAMDETGERPFDGSFAKSKEEAIQKKSKFLSIAYGIDLIVCPPKDPVSTIRKIVEGSATPFFDIDVDYFADMQNECYTPMKGAEPYQLGNLERVLRLIRSVKPPVITVSEATVNALNNPQSKTNYLLERLKNMGYDRKDFFLFESDEKAYRFLKLWEDFEKYWKENRDDADRLNIEKDDLGKPSEGLSKAAQEYFAKNKHLMT